MNLAATSKDEQIIYYYVAKFFRMRLIDISLLTKGIGLKQIYIPHLMIASAQKFIRLEDNLEIGESRTILDFDD